MSRVLPILFNTDMVRAILDGRKTVTRRVCKDGNDFIVPDMSFYDADKRTYAVHNYADKEHTDKLSLVERTCPICPGDILYARETWGISNFDYDEGVVYIVYKASENAKDEGCRAVKFPDDKFEKYYDSMSENSPEWRPSIHMPKEAARIWLKVTGVRVERLQEITEKQAKAEGVKHPCVCDKSENKYIEIPKSEINSPATYRFGFAKLWNSTMKKSNLDRYDWDANPYVFVIEFEQCEKPEEL